MNSNPTISIIVPVYNVEDFLGNCVESILAQTFKDFELILVDDGSQDNSWQICNRYADKDSRIKIFQKENGGVTLAREKGWQESIGSWVVFVDSDDTITFDCLEILLTEAINNNCDIVKGGMQSTGNGRKWLHKNTDLMSRKEYLESLFLKQTYAYLCASIYRRELFKKSSFQIDKSIKIGEDVLTCIELGLRVNKAMNLNQIIYHYQSNDASAMNSKIMHPSYIERIFNIITNLLQQVEGLNDNLYSIRKRDLHLNLIRAFFSPFIPFDSKYYYHLNTQLQGNFVMKGGGRDRLFILALKNKIFAKITKKSYFGMFMLKNKLLGNSVNEREILY